MERIRNLFKSVDTRYLVKSYAISIVVGIIFILAYIERPGPASFYEHPFYIVICMVLFPFSALVWDELIDLFMSGNTLILPLVPLIVWKTLKILYLFILSVIIAPIGILYIVFSNRKASGNDTISED